MSVTVKFAERMKPPSAVNPQPTITEVPDEVISTGAAVGTTDGWLIVLDAMDVEVAAYCPGSVLRATVDGSVAGTEVPAEAGPTDGDGAATAAATDAPTTQDAAPTPSDSETSDLAAADVPAPSDAEPADVPTVG
jgi:hypothetical protein